MLTQLEEMAGELLRDLDRIYPRICPVCLAGATGKPGDTRRRRHAAGCSYNRARLQWARMRRLVPKAHRPIPFSALKVRLSTIGGAARRG